MKGKILKGIKLLRKHLLGHGVVNYKNQGEIHFIDVGALGDLPEPWFTHAKQIKSLLSFEPLTSEKSKPNVITSSSALWEENTTLPFYIYKGLGGSGSSLFEQNYAYVKQHYQQLKEKGNPWLAKTWFERSQLADEKQIECTTLDNVLQTLQLPYTFDFLKIDAQGAEYQILKGAEQFLRKDCLGLQLELFNIPLYKGISLLPTVKAYLENYSFELVKKLPPHGSFNSQNDCIFLKSTVSKKNKHKIQLLKAIYDV